MFVHIHKSPSAPLLDINHTPSKEEWIAAAIRWYQFYYTYYEKTKEEAKELNRQKSWLLKTMPSEFKTGCHLIGPRRAYCGEDIYVAYGVIQHAIWCRHKECNKPAIIGVKEDLWCGVCDKAVAHHELKD